MPLLALDDTDTRDGGCTTRTALAIAAAIHRAGGVLADWGLVEPPRLVRLCPAVPWKTRGNGALVLPIDRQWGEPLWIGHEADTPLRTGAAQHDAVQQVPQEVADALTDIVRDRSPVPGEDEADPQPGAVLLPSPPDPSLYTRAVAGIVSADEAWRASPASTIRLSDRPRRGEIGALAAAAWPATRYTWEWIAYRPDTERSPGRELSDATVTRLLATPGAFDDHDAATGRLRCVPRTPCPVLYGLRGLDPRALLATAADVRDGRTGGWLLRTNHATGDHARYALPEPARWSVVRLAVDATGRPTRGRGGHLFLPAQGAAGACSLAAFEPTKGLRDALATVHPGDRLEVVARTGADLKTLRLEGFRTLHHAPRASAQANPRCPTCGRAMKSAGRASGYRCRPCGTRSPHLLLTPRPQAGHHQVPDHVRGHLLPPIEGLAGGLPLRDEAPGEAVPPVFQATAPPPSLVA